MSYFREVLDLLNSNQITRDEADELFAEADVSDALKYADTESAIKDTQLVDDAHKYISQRYKAMQNAGLPASVAPFLDGMTDLPGSSGTVPTEFRWNTGNGTLRIATEYGDVNPLTGQNDINPFLDPTDKSRALTLFEGNQEQARKLGRLGQDAGGKATGGPEKATEYVQRNIYRRSGQPIVMNNRGTVTDTDMILPREGQRPLKIDGQATRPSNPWKPGMERGTYWRPGSQLYTRVNFSGGQRLGNRDRINQAKSRFAQLIDSNPEMSLSQLMDGAYRKGYLSGYGYGNVPPVKGKVMDTSHQPKDKTFWTIYDTEFSNRNEDAFDTINKAPDGVMMEFNDRSRGQVEALRGEDLKNSVFFTPAQDKALRMQVDHTVLDSDALRRSEDVLKEMPEIKQFTNYEQPVDEFIIPKGQPTTKTFTKETPGLISKVGKTMDAVKAVAKNPAIRLAGAAIGAVPILGDAVDASTGTYDAITKKGDERVRGVGNAGAGIAGLTALAAPAAAPVLAPISAGLGIGNALADNAQERRETDPALTINSDKAENAGAFIHTEEAPVTIQAPTARTSSWADRRRNRRSSG